MIIHIQQVGFFKSSIGRHEAFEHNYKFEGFKFVPLTRLYIDSRGGDWDKTILKVEARWIFNLQAWSPPGLNDAICFYQYIPDLK